jgi:peptide/nickel transport system ATP-binding protein
MSNTTLIVEDLKVYYWTKRGALRAVDGIDFSISRGERFGIVGESGCGKTTTAMAILRLIRPPGFVQGGRVYLDGLDLLSLSEERMRRARWSKISYIPQGAMNTLNPVMRIGEQMEDIITTHEGSQPREEMRQRITYDLHRVGLNKKISTMYPHELSGGMKQRVCIAMSIELNPVLIIADEPTSALDVVVQRLVTETLVKVQEELGSSLIVIGHDMGLLAQLVHRLAVMYAGKIVEVGEVLDMYKAPLHPYTQLIIASIPSIKEKRVLETIPGMPPQLLSPLEGCVFCPRCPKAMEICRQEEPKLRDVGSGRLVACHLYNKP